MDAAGARFQGDVLSHNHEGVTLHEGVPGDHILELFARHAQDFLGPLDAAHLENVLGKLGR
ncbi:hypothetical protein SDC9_96629 [bioreactor metagenome]|uniref:Uncharacterized protein n=1 Tax=bioreactor metagenome TaxID=1076179 RepID=A0A645A9L0_9ZZZZ